MPSQNVLPQAILHSEKWTTEAFYRVHFKLSFPLFRAALAFIVGETTTMALRRYVFSPTATL